MQAVTKAVKPDSLRLMLDTAFMLWELSVTEQRYRAVLEVLTGVPVTEVAGRTPNYAGAILARRLSPSAPPNLPLPAASGASNRIRLLMGNSPRRCLRSATWPHSARYSAPRWAHAHSCR